MMMMMPRWLMATIIGKTLSLTPPPRLANVGGDNGSGLGIKRHTLGFWPPGLLPSKKRCQKQNPPDTLDQPLEPTLNLQNSPRHSSADRTCVEVVASASSTTSHGMSKTPDVKGEFTWVTAPLTHKTYFSEAWGRGGLDAMPRR